MSSQSPAAAVIQMTSGTSVAANLSQAENLLTQAADAGAKLAVLPENFALMGQQETDKYAIAEVDGDGPIQAWLQATAQRLKLWVVAGTMPLKLEHEVRVAPACVVVNAHGERVARYDKIHLFDVNVADATRSYRESATMAPGDEMKVIDTPIGRLGLAICYDMRFPELFRRMSAATAEGGAEVFAIPAAFTVPTGRAHWEVLLRARAIENLSYVLASGQVGLHDNGRETYGHSMIINHWGEVLALRTAQPGMALATIDRQALHEQRQTFPALTHRRVTC